MSTGPMPEVAGTTGADPPPTRGNPGNPGSPYTITMHILETTHTCRNIHIRANSLPCIYFKTERALGQQP